MFKIINESGEELSPIVNRVINAIKKDRFNFRKVFEKERYFNYMVNMNSLNASYGVIGWVINIDGFTIAFDWELSEFIIN